MFASIQPQVWWGAVLVVLTLWCATSELRYLGCPDSPSRTPSHHPFAWQSLCTNPNSRTRGPKRDGGQRQPKKAGRSAFSPERGVTGREATEREGGSQLYRPSINLGGEKDTEQVHRAKRGGEEGGNTGVRSQTRIGRGDVCGGGGKDGGQGSRFQGGGSKKPS